MDTIIDNTSVRSPSSRRAWIEIVDDLSSAIGDYVALLAEGVDRNTLGVDTGNNMVRRPPRGGRG